MLTIDFNGKQVNFDFTNLVWWVIIGLVAGLLASALTHRGGTLIGDILLGIVGAIVGGFVFSLLGLSTYGLLGTILAATIGAVLVVLLIRAIGGGRRRGRGI